MAIAMDIGTRYARIARIGHDGAPELAALPGSVPGEGLPLQTGAGSHRSASLRTAYTAYCAHIGAPDRVVLVVPQEGRADYARRAVDTLTAAHDADRAPEIRALSTPHAVLALLRHTGTVTAGRYTVCDLGATAAEVSVCALTGASVAVVAGGRYAPPDGYGAGFDAALLAGAGLPDDEQAHRALAAVRAEDGAGLRLELAVGRAERDPERYDDPVHQVSGREITAGVVRRALGRLTAGADRALDDAVGGTSAPPVIAAGGMARLRPLERHLAARQGAVVALPTGTDPALAAVFGAALVAAGRIDPGDRYPHAVCVATHRTVGGEPHSEELVITPAGALEPGGPTVFAEHAGHRVRVRPGVGASRPVRVRVRDTDGRATAPVSILTVPGGSPGDRFHVGVRIDADGTARLVLHPVGSGTPAEFPLGTLPTDLKGARS
ncbi:hypothetical protein AB0F96_12025 [Streptomyces sp. NPDC023998]|uniref:hypothetical protein n=1 Tax=Streptomyces sp. NPDC023998 TaxID=3154597 RepID=UPI0033F4E917